MPEQMPDGEDLERVRQPLQACAYPDCDDWAVCKIQTGSMGTPLSQMVPLWLCRKHTIKMGFAPLEWAKVVTYLEIDE